LLQSEAETFSMANMAADGKKTYRVGIIGRTGKGGYGHALDTAWSAVPQTRVVAVADDNKSGLGAAARKLKLQRSFLDYRKMLDEAKLDIVAVCPRWVDQHAAMVLAAAERGIHVYMEKPFCRTLEEADRIVATCEKTHARVQIAHPTRFSPLIDTIKKLIADGAIGTLLEFRGRGKEDRRGGGEDLWVLGSHVLDMIRALHGAPSSCYARVGWKGHSVSGDDVFEGPEGIGPLAGDNLQAVYQMKDGVTAHFASVRNQAGNPRRYGLQIYGSRGVIELIEGTLPSVQYLGDPSWSPGRSGASWQHVSSAGIGKPEPLKGPRYQARHTLGILDLLDAIESGREPSCGMHEGRGVVEMIAACFESHRIGAPVQLPLKSRANPLTRF
jgi:predicted dehydrogenase